MLVFDHFVKYVQSLDRLTLPLSETGWAPRILFIANNGTSNIGFSGFFNTGVVVKSILGGISIIMMSLYLI